MRVLAIDPGASAGFAVVEGPPATVLYALSAKPAHAEDRLAAWWNLMADYRRIYAVDRVVIEAPCYVANQGRPVGVTAALGERVGELRALAFGLDLPVEMISWDRWQKLPGWGEKMVSGPRLSERRSYRYAVDVLGVPRAWLKGPNGGRMDDAATACCIGAAVVAGIR